MKVAYCTNAWGSVMAHCGAANNVNGAYYVATGDDETAIRSIAKTGFEYIEMFDGNLLAYEERTDELQIIFDRYQVSLKGVYSAGNFIYDEVLSEELYKIERTAKIAASLGADQLVLGGGAVRYDGIRDEDYKKLARALDLTAEMAAQHGLTASFHPHMGSLVESPGQLDRVMEQSKILLCPDCGHVYLGGGDPYTVTKKYLDRIEYFHLKGVDENGVFCPIDRGVIDFKPIMELLAGSDHAIQLAIECDCSSADPLADAKAGYEYLA